MSQIVFRGKIVTCIPPIEANDFDSIYDFGKCVDEQDFPFIMVSSEALDKADMLINMADAVTKELNNGRSV